LLFQQSGQQEKQPLPWEWWWCIVISGRTTRIGGLWRWLWRSVLMATGSIIARWWRCH